MNLLLLIAATRAFVVVSPETPADSAAAALAEHQLLSAARKQPEKLFKIMSMGRLLRGKSAAHVNPRKEAARLLDEARVAYGELDLEKAVALLRSAHQKAEAGLASRKGPATFMAIQLELGLRLWELENPEGKALLASILALEPSTPLPPDTQLSETMADAIEMMRMDPKLDQTLTFRSDIGAVVLVGDRHCTTPCTIDTLPAGQIPWRATIPGFEPMGGVARGGDTVVLKPEALGDYAQLVASWGPLWKKGPEAAADVLGPFAERAKAAKKANIIWVVVGAHGVAMLRAGVQPETKLVHRVFHREGPVNGEALVGWVESQMGAPATVAAPPRGKSPLAAIGKWFSGIKLPDLRPSKKTVMITGATVAGAAVVAGIAVAIASEPDGPSASYDPVLGF